MLEEFALLSKNPLLALILGAASFTAACGGDSANTNNANTSNANIANTSRSAIDAPAEGVRSAPGDSEIRTETVSGTTTETRTFKNQNSPVEKVVVTRRDGRRTARVHYRSGEVRELTTEGDIERALDASADALVAIGGKVVDVTKDVGSEIGDKAEDVGDKAKSVAGEVGDKAEDAKDQTVKGAKKVGSVTADKAEDVGDKTVSGAKKVGKATVKGAKKTGGAIKDAITP